MENVFHNNINIISPAAPKARAAKEKKIIFLHKGRNAIRFPSALQKDKRTGEMSSAAFFLSASAETAAEENITCTTETVLPFSNRLHGIFCFGFKKKSFFFRISY